MVVGGWLGTMEVVIARFADETMVVFRDLLGYAWFMKS